MNNKRLRIKHLFTVFSMESAIQRAFCLFLLCITVALPTFAHASQPLIQDGLCSQTGGAESKCEEGQICQDGDAIPFFQGQQDVFGTEDQTVNKPVIPNIPESASGAPEKSSAKGESLIVYFFWGQGCPHCEKEKSFLHEMKTKYPTIDIRDYEVWHNKGNAQLFEKMAKAYGLKEIGVPMTFVGGEAFVGFTGQSRGYLENAITQASKGKTKVGPVDIPFIGGIDSSELSLPLLTLVIAGLDSFNPCAFFVLFSLLGLLVYAQSRKKMFFIGGIFVFFSGFIYFLFMSAWLNFFLIVGQVATITKIAGAVSLGIAIINIKDFFAFKKGISLTIPDSAKPKLFDRMRRLLKSTSLLSIAAGTAVLAIAANSYELLCTAGFPMVFTRILTLNDLSNPVYYLYLVFYNVIYVIPLLIIVTVFAVTLGKRKLSEWQGRVLKLASGTMMLGLGGVLFLNPVLLNDVKISFFILVGACALCACIVFLTRQIDSRRNPTKA